MLKRLKIKLLEDFDWNVNERKYYKDEEIEVVKFDSTTGGLSKAYAHYYDDNLDCIPVDKVDIIGSIK